MWINGREGVGGVEEESGSAGIVWSMHIYEFEE